MTTPFTINGQNWTQNEKISEITRAVAERNMALLQSNIAHKWTGYDWIEGAGLDPDIATGTDLQHPHLYAHQDYIPWQGEGNEAGTWVDWAQNWIGTNCHRFLPPNITDYAGKEIQTIGEEFEDRAALWNSAFDYFCYEVVGGNLAGPPGTNGQGGFRRSTDGSTWATRGTHQPTDYITGYVDGESQWLFDDIIACLNALALIKYIPNDLRAAPDGPSNIFAGNSSNYEDGDLNRAAAIAFAESEFATASGSYDYDTNDSDAHIVIKYTRTNRWDDDDWVARGRSILLRPTVYFPFDFAVKFYAVAVKPTYGTTAFYASDTGWTEQSQNYVGGCTGVKDYQQYGALIGNSNVPDWPTGADDGDDTICGVELGQVVGVMAPAFSNGIVVNMGTLSAAVVGAHSPPTTDYADGYFDGDALGYADAVANLGYKFDYDDGHPDSSYEFQRGYAAGYDIGYQRGHDEYTTQYNLGYAAGHTLGFNHGWHSVSNPPFPGISLGYDAGYAAGYAVGYQAGYAAGYAAGQPIGFDQGFLDARNYDPEEYLPAVGGYNIGYNAGYAAGYQAGS